MIKFAGCIAIAVLALSVISFADHTTLPELIARADAAKPEEQPKLYMEIAEHEIKLADDARKTDQTDEFVHQLQNVVTHSGKATSAALQTNKDVKKTELKIRRISHHLHEIEFDVDPDAQGAVQEAMNKLESFRTSLLKKMFGGKAND